MGAKVGGYVRVGEDGKEGRMKLKAPVNSSRFQKLPNRFNTFCVCALQRAC